MQLPKSLSRLASLTDGARSARWIQSLPLWLSVGLVVLLAWQLVQLTWTILGARKASGAPPAGAPGVAAPAGPSFDLQSILNAHLFGVAGATDPGATAFTRMLYCPSILAIVRVRLTTPDLDTP